jgi:hypothetical protein
MIEIALALGVIAFALVAIIGVLPFGLNVQKESHQDTVISQDAPFFLSTIANGGIAATNTVTDTGLDFLTNYIESIAIVSSSSGGAKTTNFPPINNGKEILGALTTPEFYPCPPIFGVPPYQTNLVVARIRSLSGNALEQGGANGVVAFRYFMYVEIVPFESGADQQGFTANGNLQSDLYDVHLKFSWPVTGVSPNYSVGTGRAHFRTMVSGQLLNFTNTPYIYWYMQPNSYSTANLNNP